MASDLFDYRDYQAFLAVRFSGTGEGRGRRRPLAEFLRCQVSFISQVLTGRAQLSLEHALRTTEFLNLSADERSYFMLLVQRARAGSPDLEAFFDRQIEQVQTERQSIKGRIGVETQLNAEDQMTYYSAWHYSAIHVLSALPDFNTAEAMAERLKLDLPLVKEVLTFLEQRGFVDSQHGVYRMGRRRMHLAKGSKILPRHHSNWRMKAVEAVDREKNDDLHYSSLMGIARKDIKRFKEQLLKLIESFEPIIRASLEEVPVVLIMDLFEL